MKQLLSVIVALVSIVVISSFPARGASDLNCDEAYLKSAPSVARIKCLQQDITDIKNTLQVLLGSMKNYVPVPQTGQKIIYKPGDDGDLQKGVAWPIPRFKDNGDGTVTDNLTMLIWTKDSQLISANKDWYDALNACNNLSFAGYDDWRLPNINELLSLVDWGSHPHLLPDNPFVNVWYYEYYWSSTSEDSNTALTVGFSGASIVHFGKTYAAGKYVWCARGGK